jgi:hydroxyethylthiazole kinase
MGCHHPPDAMTSCVTENGLLAAAGNVKGVDSTASSHEALDSAKKLAQQYGCVVAVSGATDLVRAPQPCFSS